jgi:putative heme iron utilization protein
MDLPSWGPIPNRESAILYGGAIHEYELGRFCSSIIIHQIPSDTTWILTLFFFLVLSILSFFRNPGFPGGSVVGFAPDEEGRPLFVFSGMSSHTQDILADPRCSLTVAAKEFKGAADGRVNLMGTCERVKDPELIQQCKATYLEKHPGAFWVEFGDFFWYRMTVEAVRFVGGFARAGSVTAEEYVQGKPDPIMKFGNAIAGHMNDDHMSSTVAMVEHYIPGLVVTANEGDSEPKRYVQKAEITSVDSLGMFVKITRDPENDDQLPGQPQQFKLRLPFPNQVMERGDVKQAIVEMTQASSVTAKKTQA